MLPEIDELERMIGRDLSAWKGPRADRTPEFARIAVQRR
jgi:hypothetical protein